MGGAWYQNASPKIGLPMPRLPIHVRSGTGVPSTYLGPSFCAEFEPTRVQDQEAAEWPCPLCTKVGFLAPGKFKSHVCAHMEDIALGALPREMYGNDEDDSSSEEGGDLVAAEGLTIQANLDQDKSTSSRCKVYESRDHDWRDHGTGSCSCQIINVRDDNDCVTNASAWTTWNTVADF